LRGEGNAWSVSYFPRARGNRGLSPYFHVRIWAWSPGMSEARGLLPNTRNPTNKHPGYVPLHVLFGVVGLLILVLEASAIFLPHSTLCGSGLLGDISGLFRRIPEVDSLSRNSTIGCCVSICVGISLVFGPLLGGLINLTRIDRDPLRNLGRGQTRVSRLLTPIFMFLLVISPYTFGGGPNEKYQISHSFYALVVANKSVLLAYSIGLLFFLAIVWAYLIHCLFYFGDSK